MIVGTFPTAAKSNFPFFYSGEKNLFWKVVKKIYKKKFQWPLHEIAANERIEFMKSKGIGFIDMHQECYRVNRSSKDTSLYPVKTTNVPDVLDKYPNIRVLIFTSRTAGVGALGLFNTSLYLHGHEKIILQDQ